MDDQITRTAGRAADSARRSVEETSAKVGETAENLRDQVQRAAGDTIGQARTMARDLGEQARTVARDLGEQARSVANAAAENLPRQARQQVVATTDMIYRQSAWAGDYLVRQVTANPVTAVLAAAAVGYTLAYMIHSRSE